MEDVLPWRSEFVNRKDWVDWMTQTVKSCGKRTIVVHIHGIGGIGKSLLLRHWTETISNSVIIDFSMVQNIQSRLSRIAEGIRQFGHRLPRFDLLWAIKKRMVDGIEPSSAEGFEWLAEPVSLVPVVGGLVDGMVKLGKMARELKTLVSRRYGNIGKWLRKELGKNWSEEMQIVLWKELQRATVLLMKALQADINDSKDQGGRPLLIMLDHFEFIDRPNRCWTIRGKRTSEAELWHEFLSGIKGCIGITSGRDSFDDEWCKSAGVQQREIDKFDFDSCMELAISRSVTDETLLKSVIPLSHQHPLLLDLFCDAITYRNLTAKDIIGIEAEPLEEAKLVAWRTLFSRASQVLQLVDRAALLPLFNKHVLAEICHDMRDTDWRNLVGLSFVAQQDNDWWKMHSLARELAISELGIQKKRIIEETKDVLLDRFRTQKDSTLLGLAISAQAILSEQKAIQALEREGHKLLDQGRDEDLLHALEITVFRSEQGKAFVEKLSGTSLVQSHKYGEAEAAFNRALDTLSTIEKEIPGVKEEIAELHMELGYVYYWTLRPDSAEYEYETALRLLQEIEKDKDQQQPLIAEALCRLGSLHLLLDRLDKARGESEESLRIWRSIDESVLKSNLTSYALSLNALGSLYLRTGESEKAEATLVEAFEVFQKLDESGSKRHRVNYAFNQRCLGQLYIDLEDDAKAEKALRLSVRILRERIEETSNRHNDELGLTLLYLGILYSRMGKSADAERAFEEGLLLFEELAKVAPEICRIGIGDALDALANHYNENGREKESIELYNKALKVRRELASIEPRIHEPAVAATLSNLSVVLAKIGSYDSAESYLRESIKIIERLVKDEPTLYLPTLAGTYANLGSHFAVVGRIGEAEKMTEKSLRISTGLYEESPDIYRDDVARAKLNLALIHLVKEETKAAEAELRNTIKLVRVLMKTAPESYQQYLAVALQKLGQLHLYQKHFDEAEKELNEAFDIYLKLVTRLPEVYQEGYAETLDALAWLYTRTDKNEKAEDAYNLCIMAYQELAERMPNVFTHVVARKMNDLAVLYFDSEEPKKAEEILSQVMDMCIELFKKDKEEYRDLFNMVIRNLSAACNGLGYTQKEWEERYYMILELAFEDMLDEN